MFLVASSNTNSVLKKTFKPPFQQAAFTLIELIIVVAILAILATYILTRPDSSQDYQQDAVIERLISSGRLAQQLSMNDSTRNFVLSIQANQIDLTVDGSSFASASINYPLTVSSNVTLSPVTTITFDNLGQTSSTTISVQGASTQQVCFESGGMIREC